MGFLSWLWQGLGEFFKVLIPGRWRPRALVYKLRGKIEESSFKAEQALKQAADQGDEKAIRTLRWQRWGRRLRWVLHFLLIAAIVAGLAYINYAFDLER